MTEAIVQLSPPQTGNTQIIHLLTAHVPPHCARRISCRKHAWRVPVDVFFFRQTARNFGAPHGVNCRLEFVRRKDEPQDDLIESVLFDLGVQIREIGVFLTCGVDQVNHVSNRFYCCKYCVLFD